MATLTIKLPDKSETPISIDVFQKVCMELTKSIQQFLTTNHPPKLWMTTVCNKQTETHTIEMPEIKN